MTSKSFERTRACRSGLQDSIAPGACRIYRNASWRRVGQAYTVIRSLRIRGYVCAVPVSAVRLRLRTSAGFASRRRFLFEHHSRGIFAHDQAHGGIAGRALRFRCIWTTRGELGGGASNEAWQDRQFRRLSGSGTSRPRCLR